jgi:hypothetical protein
MTNSLPVVRLTFTAQVRENAPRLSEFMGNKIRGALGRKLYSTSAYNAIFKVESGTSVPQPYTVDVDYPLARDADRFDFGISLFGYACDYREQIADIVCTMMPEFAIECTDNDFAVWSDEHADAIAAVSSLKVSFITPLVLKDNAKPDFSTVIDSIFGRVGDIIDSYTDGEFVLPYAVTHRKPFITAEYDLRDVSIELEKPPKIDGVVGSVTYHGVGLERYMPYFDIGSVLHAGKLTTRGCGLYEYEMR